MDLEKFKHGLEDTHYACEEMTRQGVDGWVWCCECSNHECQHEELVTPNK